MAKQDFIPDTGEIQGVFKGLRIHDSIGAGGQKVVFEAFHTEHGRIALKLVKPGNAEDRSRSLREIEVSKDVAGPHFARIYDYGETMVGADSVLFIFEEFLEGQNLRRILEKERSLSLSRTLEVAEAVLEALVVLHGRNVVHRDIKPENIFVTREGRIVVLDMGIARHLSLDSLTADAAPFGPLTPGYGAPEQITNKKRIIGWGTDMFLFGVVVYECLTGSNPFVTGHVGETLQNTLRVEPTALRELGFNRLFTLKIPIKILFLG